MSGAATWLRDTLAKKVADAGDHQQDARNDACGRWEGETASSYQTFSGDTLKANDKHEGRIEDAAADYQTFVDWVDSTMPGAVAKAREKDGSDELLDTVQGMIPNFAGGVGAGLSGSALSNAAKDLKGQARELKRKSRVSGDPRIRGSVDTPAGKAKLDDLLGKSDWLGKGGRLLGGPAGILIDVGFGVKDGMDPGTGDARHSPPAPASRSEWVRPLWWPPVSSPPPRGSRSWQPAPWPPVRRTRWARSTTTGTTSPTRSATPGTALPTPSVTRGTARPTRSATRGTR